MIQSTDGDSRLVAFHLDLAESLAPAREHVRDQADRMDLAERREQFGQLLFGRCAGQSTNRNRHHGSSPLQDATSLMSRLAADERRFEARRIGVKQVYRALT